MPVIATFAGDTLLPDRQRSVDGEPARGDAADGDAGTGTYNGSTPITGTLINTYTDQPVPDEPVTFRVNGTQTCTGDDKPMARRRAR